MSSDLMEPNLAGLSPVTSLAKRHGVKYGRFCRKKGREGLRLARVEWRIVSQAGWLTTSRGGGEGMSQSEGKAKKNVWVMVCANPFYGLRLPWSQHPVWSWISKKSGEISFASLLSDGPVPGNCISRPEKWWGTFTADALYYRGSLGGSHPAHTLSFKNNIIFTYLSSLDRGYAIELNPFWKRTNWLPVAGWNSWDHVQVSNWITEKNKSGKKYTKQKGTAQRLDNEGQSYRRWGANMKSSIMALTYAWTEWVSSRGTVWVDWGSDGVSELGEWRRWMLVGKGKDCVG